MTLNEITNKSDPNQLHQIRSEKELIDSSENGSLGKMNEGGSKESDKYSSNNNSFSQAQFQSQKQNRNSQSKSCHQTEPKQNPEPVLSEQDIRKFDLGRFERYRWGKYTMIFPFNKKTHELSIQLNKQVSMNSNTVNINGPGNAVHMKALV